MKKYDYLLLKVDDFPEGFNFGGNPLYIPKADSISKRLRDNSIKQDYKNGVPINQLCKDYNLSFNQVRGICSLAYLRQLSIHEYIDED